MKLKLISLAMVLPLSGCLGTLRPTERPEPVIANRVEYVVKVPPAALLELPPPPAPIDPDTATQATVAQWLIANERWLQELRNRLSAIAKFLQDEQSKLNEQARKENEQAGTAGDPSKVIKPTDTQR